MRATLSALAFFVSLSSVVQAGPKEEALEVLDKWTKAFAGSDVDAIVKLHAPDALFMGTGSKTVVTATDEIKKYFEGALLTRRPRGAPISDQHVMLLSDNAVLVTGLNASTGVLDGKPFTGQGSRPVPFLTKRGGSL